MTVPVVFEGASGHRRSLPTGEPLPLAAVDTVRHTFRFAAVGECPDIDTLRFSRQPVERDQTVAPSPVLGGAACAGGGRP